ncbi:hypothetical protein LIER_16757 [Lithospermum erythrorhizon]|uniref:Uncharacterized protein n=1 Tax=Lithospermum erythrorhizon TaxID=34254 RepID=A0AAV3Q8M3_LITER
MRLPFSIFVNDLLEHINRASGQVHPIGWLNITIFQVSSNVWESVQKAADPTKIEVAAMKGKRLPRFNSQLVVRKPLIPGAAHIPVFPSKRSSTLVAFVSASKKAKVEALNAITTTSSNPQAFPTEDPNVASGEGSSLDYYTARYMKAPYSLPNGLPIEEGHLWNKCMEAFLVVHSFLSVEEGRKHPSSDPLGPFALSSIYMIQEREEELNSVKEALSAEELKAKTLQEEKETMGLEHAKRYNTLEAEMQKQKSNHSSLAKDLENSHAARVEATKRAEDAEARALKVEATKRAEDAEARALKAEELLKQVDAEVERRIAAYTKTAEFDLLVGKEYAAAVINFVGKFQEECPQLLDFFNHFKTDWPIYFEDTPTPGETVEVFRESTGEEIANEEGVVPENVNIDDEATA